MKIEVVTSGIDGCSNCERAKQLVKEVIKDFQIFKFGEINSLENPERIQSLGMVTSGAIVINDKLAFSSLPKEKVLRKKVTEIYQAYKGN
jgi:glutaredoxin